jgi:MFS family permease
MLRFLLANLRWLAAGFLLTFASTCGQTWFISLSATAIKQEYGLSDSRWGGLYTLATLASAAVMFWQGSVVDRVSPRTVAGLTAGLFALAAAGMAGGQSIWLLGLSLFLLRFCGQGMFGHIAMTTVGRWFVAQRGRAVAITNLGYPASEILLAAPAVLMINLMGWRQLWAGAAGILLVAVMPLLVWLLAASRTPQMQTASHEQPGLGGRHWQRQDAIRHWLLPALLPTLLTPGFMGTVLFFQQTNIASTKDWSLVAMAPGFSCFAMAGVLASFAAGWVVDRLGGARLLPVLLVPIGIGMAAIGMATHIATWYVALAMMGVTMGMASALWGAFLPTLYGTRHLGAIRSLSTTIMVFSTALGPGLTGLLIDRGIDVPTQCLALAAWCFTISAGSLLIKRRLSRELAATAQDHQP